MNVYNECTKQYIDLILKELYRNLYNILCVIIEEYNLSNYYYIRHFEYIFTHRDYDSYNIGLNLDDLFACRRLQTYSIVCYMPTWNVLMHI